MLRIENLKAFYDNIPALKGVSIEVSEGEVVSIIGANGAGKSTLLKSISGLMKTKEGGILYKDQDISALPANKIVSLGISQVPEGRQIFGHLTVRDNINLGAYLYFKRRNRSEIKERTESVFQLFPILKRRSKQIAGTLSGGEQQMLAIARALMGRPGLSKKYFPLSNGSMNPEPQFCWSNKMPRPPSMWPSMAACWKPVKLS
jgi:branched-chain amino acid transport system ATP-binding protein